MPFLKGHVVWVGLALVLYVALRAECLTQDRADRHLLTHLIKGAEEPQTYIHEDAILKGNMFKHVSKHIEDLGYKVDGVLRVYNPPVELMKQYGKRQEQLELTEEPVDSSVHNYLQRELYKSVARMGRGSFGVVYKACGSDGCVAVKVNGDTTTEGARALAEECEFMNDLRNIMAERQKAAMYEHHVMYATSIKKFLKIDSKGGEITLCTMPLMDGDLRNYARQRESIAASKGVAKGYILNMEYLEILGQVLEGIHYLEQAKSVMHCDLKAENIFIQVVNKRPFVRIGDFGNPFVPRRRLEPPCLGGFLVPATTLGWQAQGILGEIVEKGLRHRTCAKNEKQVLWAFGVLVVHLLCPSTKVLQPADIKYDSASLRKVYTMQEEYLQELYASGCYSNFDCIALDFVRKLMNQCDSGSNDITTPCAYAPNYTSREFMQYESISTIGEAVEDPFWGFVGNMKARSLKGKFKGTISDREDVWGADALRSGHKESKEPIFSICKPSDNPFAVLKGEMVQVELSLMSSVRKATGPLLTEVMCFTQGLFDRTRPFERIHFECEKKRYSLLPSQVASLSIVRVIQQGSPSR